MNPLTLFASTAGSLSKIYNVKASDQSLKNQGEPEKLNLTSKIMLGVTAAAFVGTIVYLTTKKKKK